MAVVGAVVVSAVVAAVLVGADGRVKSAVVRVAAAVVEEWRPKGRESNCLPVSEHNTRRAPVSGGGGGDEGDDDSHGSSGAGGGGW